MVTFFREGRESDWVMMKQLLLPAIVLPELIDTEWTACLMWRLACSEGTGTPVVNWVYFVGWLSFQSPGQRCHFITDCESFLHSCVSGVSPKLLATNETSLIIVDTRLSGKKLLSVGGVIRAVDSDFELNMLFWIDSASRSINSWVCSHLSDFVRWRNYKHQTDFLISVLEMKAFSALTLLFGRLACKKYLAVTP